jgi:hypothetical protein
LVLGPPMISQACVVYSEVRYIYTYTYIYLYVNTS